VRPVIGRASKMFDSVVVGVVNLPWRKGNTLFSAEERIAFVKDATRQMPNIEIETFSSLLVTFARERGAMAIIKGLRAISDFEYELEMNQLNRLQAPDVESLYLMASPQYSFLSSSGVILGRLRRTRLGEDEEGPAAGAGGARPHPRHRLRRRIRY